MVTRRFFIGGAAAAGAFGGYRFFRSPHGASYDVRPSMTFGVVSDVHVLGANAAPGEFCEFRGDTALWRRTLEWFRDRGVDAVMAVGEKTFALLDAAFNRPAEVLPRSVNRFTLAMDRLPSGKPHFKVVPCDCWRNRGTPIKG